MSDLHASYANCPKCKEVFDLFSDENGKMKAKDLMMAYRALDFQVTEEVNRKLFRRNYLRKSSSITFEKFIKMMDSLEPGDTTEEDILQLFRIFDKGGYGFIKIEELSHVLSTFGEALNEEEMNDLVRLGDVNEDGLIDYEKLVKKLSGE